MHLSPFSSILQLYGTAHTTGTSLVGELLQSVASEYNMLQKFTTVPSFLALLFSLKEDKGYKPSDSTYKFLDNCVLRLVRKPIKYFGDMEEYAHGLKDTLEKRDNPIISLLTMAIVEQWPFLVKSHESNQLMNAASWVARYLKCSRDIGEDSHVLGSVRDRLMGSTEEKSVLSIFSNTFEQSISIAPGLLEGSQEHESKAQDSPPRSVRSQSPHNTELEHLTNNLEQALNLPTETENHPGLNRWSRRDVLEGIEDGAVADLLMCLCSQHEEIRRQALVNLKLLMSKLEVSVPLPVHLLAINS